MLDSGSRTPWGRGQSWRVPMDLFDSQPGRIHIKSLCEWHSFKIWNKCHPTSFSRTTTSSAPALLFPKASTTTSAEELARLHSDDDADATAILTLMLGSFWSLYLTKLILNLTINIQILTAAHNLKKIGPNEYDFIFLFLSYAYEMHWWLWWLMFIF